MRETVYPDASGGQPLVATRAYWVTNDSPAASFKEQLKGEWRPDGSWTYYYYDLEQSPEMHRPERIVTGWKDNAPNSDFSNGPDAILGMGRATRYYYWNPQLWNPDDGTLFPRRPRRTEERVLTHLISSTWYAYRAVQDAQQPNAYNLEVTEKRNNRYLDYIDSANLTTVTTYVGMDEGKPKEVVFPDHRKDTYAYDDCNYTLGANHAPTVVISPNLPFKRTAIDHAGTAGVLVPNKSTRDVTVRDLAGRTLVEESYVYSGSAWERIGWAVHAYDDRGHLLATYKSDNTETHAGWDCCAQLWSTDETGIRTFFDPPDALGRVRHSRKEGVAGQPDINTSYTFDAMDRVTLTMTSGGGLTLSNASSYDWAGRLLLSTDQASLPTQYAYCSVQPPPCPEPAGLGSGCRRTEVTSPGTAQQITELYLDGRIRCVTGGTGTPRYYDYGVEQVVTDPATNPTVWAIWTKVSYNDSSPLALRYEKTWVDGLGRQIQQEKPGFRGTYATAKLLTNWYYDSVGRLQHVATNYVTTTSGGGGGPTPGGGDPSGFDGGVYGGGGHHGGGGTRTATPGADVWYNYDEMSNVFRTGANLNGAADLQLFSNDRITDNITEYARDSENHWWNRTTTTVYPEDGGGSPLVSSVQSQQLTGLPAGVTSYTESTDSHGHVAKATRLIDHSAKKVTEITDLPLSTTDAITVSVNGLLQTSQTAAGLLYIYGYDGLGRQTTVTDPRTGTSTTHYDPQSGRVDRVEDTLRPTPNRTSYEYFGDTGRLKSLTRKTPFDPTGKTTYYDYDPRGQVTHIWGVVPPPVEMVYDGYGQRTELHTFRAGTAWNGTTWPTNATTPDVTRMSFDPATGLLTDKVFADQKKVSYTFTPGGAIATRKWARVGPIIVTTYGYDATTGELTSITYSGATPGVSFTYDRLGRRKTVTQNSSPAMTHQFDYDGLDLSTETVAGPYDKVITHIDTSDGHRNVQPLDPIPYPPPPDGYDRQVLVGTDIDPSQDYAALYHYNGVGRLQSVVGPGLGNGYVQYSYLANGDLAEREDIKSSAAVTLGSAIRTYEPYRDLRTWARNQWGGQNVSTYAYYNDALGRRYYAARWGAAFPTPQDEGWDYNNRNELTRAQEYVPDPEGADGDPWVSVRDQAYVYDNIGNRKTYTRDGGTPTTYTADNLNRYYPGTTNPTENFTYDLDGNLTQDGSYNYTWDGENRLSSVTPRTPSASNRQLKFTYDYMNRRVRKQVFAWNSTAWSTLEKDTRFVYDGWNLLLELNGLNTGGTGVPPVIRKYTWGSDLSGSLQGAGGIGGLLAMQDVSGGTGVPPVNLVYFYDANGNVGQLVNLADGSLAATYEYDPYGNLLSLTGPYATTNPFRFSTKYFDGETGMYYYGERYYIPRLGRWVNHDPIGERGGTNLYGFCGNDSIDTFDALGLRWKIRRTGGAQAEAAPENGDTVADLALIIGLNGDDYRRWLTPDDNDMPVSQYASLSACERFAIPNTVVAYWAGIFDGFGRWWVHWHSSLGYLSSLGFNVSEIRHFPGDYLGLQNNLIGSASSKQLHGLYFWGHGGGGKPPTGYPAIALYADDWLGGDRVLTFEETYSRLNYKMALGIVFACDSNSGHYALMSQAPAEIWHGFTGTLIPWAGMQLNPRHWIHHGDQGTK